MQPLIILLSASAKKNGSTSTRIRCNEDLAAASPSVWLIFPSASTVGKKWAFSSVWRQAFNKDLISYCPRMKLVANTITQSQMQGSSCEKGADGSKS